MQIAQFQRTLLPMFNMRQINSYLQHLRTQEQTKEPPPQIAPLRQNKVPLTVDQMEERPEQATALKRQSD
jgi:hypothetical protein